MKTGDKSIPLQVTDVGYVADSCKQPSTAIYDNVNPTLSANQSALVILYVTFRSKYRFSHAECGD
jgi:hypothetical protein